MRIIPVLTVVLLNVAPAIASWDLDLETGYVDAGYNNVRIPGDSGTRLSLTDDLNVAGKAFYRVRLTKDIGDDQFVSFLYAPLSLNASGVTAIPVNYNGDILAAGRLEGVYRFDSYRATWYRLFNAHGRFNYKLGFTAKIRDASIRLSDGAAISEKKNTGIVPLLHFGLAWRFTGPWTLVLDGDALAGGPGRAEDVLFALMYSPGKQYAFRIGYRFVEGGSDTKEVYNFALLNYAVAGATVSF